MEASFTILFLLFILATTLFWIWALVDVIRRPGEDQRRGSELSWALSIAITHSLGAVAYVLLGRPPGAGMASVGR